MTAMKYNKYLHGFINKVFPSKAVNGVYNTTDYLQILLEAAQKNGFLEGTCKQVDGACDAETILDKLAGLSRWHLYDIFLELIRQQLKKVKALSRNRKIVVAVDITHDAYYGECKSIWIHKFKPEKGSTGSYQFMVISIVLNGERFILGILPLRVGDRKVLILKKLLNEAMRFVPIDVVLLDRGFNSAKVIHLLKNLKLRYMILWRKHKWQRKVFKLMKQRKFYRLKNHELFVKEENIVVKTDMVFVKGIKVEGDKKAYHWVFATNVYREKPIHYIHLYKHRWAIETKFRVTDELQIKTKTKDIGKRFFLALFTVLLYNLWKWFRFITDLDVAFSEFVDHLVKVHLEFNPVRELKEKQQFVREQVKQICFQYL